MAKKLRFRNIQEFLFQRVFFVSHLFRLLKKMNSFYYLSLFYIFSFILSSKKTDAHC